MCTRGMLFVLCTVFYRQQMYIEKTIHTLLVQAVVFKE